MATLTVPGVLDSLEAITRFVLAAASQAGIDPKATYRLRLAIDEIATNMIVHGYEEAGLTGDVVVRTRIDDDALVVTLEDTAHPFDPRTHVPPDFLDRPLDERPIGGLGIFLAMKGADRFDYDYVDGRNRYNLVVNRPRG